jgi:hypothetical protein
MKIRPEIPTPTAATWNLEIGTRANGWADLTIFGSSWVRVKPVDWAIDFASEASIMNLGSSILIINYLKL